MQICGIYKACQDKAKKKKGIPVAFENQYVQQRISGPGNWGSIMRNHQTQRRSKIP